MFVFVDVRSGSREKVGEPVRKSQRVIFGQGEALAEHFRRSMINQRLLFIQRLLEERVTRSLAASSLRQQIASIVGKPMKKCPTDAPKVDPRIRRTHKMLEEAFRSLLADGHGCDLSVSDLTERATVNRATFYAHFEDIHHFATTILLADLDAALLARLPPGTPLCAPRLASPSTSS